VYYGLDTPTTLAITTAGTTATITELTANTVYYVRLRVKNANGISEYGVTESSVPNDVPTPGLYQRDMKIGDQNLSTSLSWISTNTINGDDYTIVIGADESISPKSLSYSGKTVEITLLGYGSERIINLSANGSIFTVNSGVTLTIDKNITLVGRSANNAPLVDVQIDSTLIMNDGAKITGNTGYVGGVRVSGGTFIMYGGIISENTATTNEGGGVLISAPPPGSVGNIYFHGGTFIMRGGKISKNKNTLGNGGGVTVMTASTFTMIDGVISGNTSVNGSGGGVHVFNEGKFTMRGGIISGNTSKLYGGGVYDGYSFIKSPQVGGDQTSGIIYGSEAFGIDMDGIPLGNYSANGDAIFRSNVRRNTTAWQTDHIDTTTGRGLSASGNPPFGQ
jgi:hypothetical protein